MGCLCISIIVDKPWEGRLVFDKPRHKVNMRLPLDYPRINQFPEWFTARAGTRYVVGSPDGGTNEILDGAALVAGFRVALADGVERRFIVSESSSPQK